MKKNINQLNASDPFSSVWVFASAGTGKTKILIDRFLRLILSGTDINKIICITFTKAAANEMIERLMDKLFIWSNYTDEELHISISQITNSNPTTQDIENARSFYDKVIKSNREINIQTIHSLCQSILSRFPLEASINSNFRILDQSMTYSIISEIKNEIFFNNEDSESFILNNMNDLKIMDLIKDIINNHIKFMNFFDRYKSSDEYREFLIRSLNIKTLSKNEIYQAIKDLIHLPKFDRGIKLLKNDEKIINNYNRYLALNFLQKSEQFNEFKYNFLNKDGSQKSKLLSNNVISKVPELELELAKIRQVIYDVDQDLKNIAHLEFAISFYLFSKNIIKIFETLKLQNHALTYDDLINKTVYLLNNSHMKDWVLYKLDGGFNHILIDEAQDTSPLQWQIIKALVEEFFSGESYNSSNRSLFIVGDDKQSIYSFQGANVKNYLLVKNFFKDKIINSQSNFLEILLDKSYRSSKAIITSIDYIINYVKVTYPDNTGFTYNILNIDAINDFGQVEIWPLQKNSDKLKNINWPTPNELEKSDNNYTKLCYMIADFIKSEIDLKGSHLEDFMILLRKRDKFIPTLIKVLEEQGIKTSGLDRIDLKQNLSIMDLISLAKFIMLPEDDLNLSGLLLSPIIGLNDDDLLKLVPNRKTTIWQTISQEKGAIYYQLLKFINLYKNTDFVDFFIILLEGMGFRQKLNSNNGPESDDAINEFIKSVINYSKNQKPNLQDFIFWFDNSDLLFIRDTESGSCVKISTIHGAKGLESKIVILVDSCALPTDQNAIFFDDDDNIFFPGKASNISDHARYIIKNSDKVFDEYLRLLYVSLTRAKQKLIICGYANSKAHEDSWYNICYQALLPEATIVDFEHGNDKKLMISEGQESISNKAKLLVTQNNFYEDKEPQELDDSGFINISREIVADNEKNKEALEYGIIFHKIMQYLIKNKLNIVVTKKDWSKNLPEKFRAKIEDKINLLKGSLLFSKLENEYKLYPEISFVLGGKIGRIDLLAVKDSEVIIIDYKTDKIVPKSLNTINQNYIDQIGFYKSAMVNLYPGKKITTQILWLETMQFMNLD